MKRTWWYWAIQILLAIVLGWLVWKTLAAHWAEFQSLEAPSDIRLGRIGAAALLVWSAYGVLILAWRTVIQGWGQHLRVAAAVRIWCVSNLGRYLPGKIWSAAGLAVLAQREGVTGWVATGAAIAMQVLAVGTGVAVVAAMAPGAATPVSLIVAGVCAVGAMVALTSKKSMAILSGLTKGKITLGPLPLPSVTAGAVAALIGWVLYGVAFWMLAGGLGLDPMPSLPLSIGVFASGYIVGLIAVFAPGGVLVREGVFLMLLEPAMGVGAATMLAVSSRVLLTATEAGAALAALVFVNGQKEAGVERSG